MKNKTNCLLYAEYNRKSVVHNILFLVVALLMIISLFFVRDVPRETFEYNEKNAVWQSQYVKIFDAFKKGQLHLDIKPSDELLELENPYDTAARDAAGVFYHWDHALYNGKYYSYFGIAPLLTTYIPVYLITGELPNDALVTLILGIYSVIFMALAYREIVLRFAKKANLWLFLLGFCALTAVSGVYYTVFIGDVYNVQVASALGCSMAFVFYALRAMRKDNIFIRCILLALAAVSLGLTVMSRPTAALMCVCIFPVFFEFLLASKKEQWRKTLITVGSFAVPLLICASVVMWYNAARFSSPFDFGEKYQLTVNDISKNTFEFNFIFSSIVSYFFYPFLISPNPLRWYMGGGQLVPYGSRYVYGEAYVGAFALVLPALILLYPRLARADEREGTRDFTKNAFAFCVAALSLIVGYVDFCKGGTHIRYVYDIIPMLSLAGLVTGLSLCAHAKGKKRILAILLCALAFIAAIYFGNVLVEHYRFSFQN